MSARNQIADLYRTYLGRNPDQGGWDGYTSQLEGGRSLQSIAREIATSDEARDNVKRANAAKSAASAYAGQVSALQGQIGSYKTRIEDTSPE